MMGFIDLIRRIGPLDQINVVRDWTPTKVLFLGPVLCLSFFSMQYDHGVEWLPGVVTAQSEKGSRNFRSSVLRPS